MELDGSEDEEDDEDGIEEEDDAYMSDVSVPAPASLLAWTCVGAPLRVWPLA